MQEGSIGGSGLNTMRALAMLGMKCKIHGMIGTDVNPICEYLESIGIESQMIPSSLKTGIANCFITQDGQDPKRSFLTYPGAELEMSSEKISREAFEGATHVHIEGFQARFPNALSKAVEYAKDVGATISVDLTGAIHGEGVKEVFEKTIDKVDFVFGNRAEMQALTGLENPKEAAESFEEKQLIVITDGPNACWIKNSGENVAASYGVSKVEGVLDSTGAGDFFLAGFLGGVLMEEPIPSCVEKACQAANFVLREYGAQLPDDKWEEMKTEMNF